MESNNICDEWAGGLNNASTLKLQCAGLGGPYDYSEVDEINQKPGINLVVEVYPTITVHKLTCSISSVRVRYRRTDSDAAMEIVMATTV